MHHAVTALYPGLAVESPSGAYSSARKLKSLLRMTLSFALYGGSRAYQNWRATHTRLRSGATVHADRLLRRPRPAGRQARAGRRAAGALLRDAAPRLPDPRPRPGGRAGRDHPPRAFGRGPIERVHTPDFVEFLATAWERWAATGRTYDALPWTWPTRHLRQIRPERIDGLMGYYSFDAGTPITAGTWRAAQASAEVALTGAKLLAERPARGGLRPVPAARATTPPPTSTAATASSTTPRSRRST